MAGFDPFSVNEDQVTVPKVKEEIRNGSIQWIRCKTAIENGKLKVRSPSEDYLDRAKASAKSVGDSFFLSETDMQILALALELRTAGCNPKIVTDDYSIQNVATKMGIEFVDTPQENIKALKEYIEKLEDSSLVS